MSKQSKFEKGYVDRQSGWICIQIAERGRHWFKSDTVSWSRKSSIKLHLNGSSMTWDDCKKFGWICRKVTIEMKLNPQQSNN